MVSVSSVKQLRGARVRVPVPAVLEEDVLQRPPRLHLLRRVPAHRALLLAVRVDREHALVTLDNKM